MTKADWEKFNKQRQEKRKQIPKKSVPASVNYETFKKIVDEAQKLLADVQQKILLLAHMEERPEDYTKDAYLAALLDAAHAFDRYTEANRIAMETRGIFEETQWYIDTAERALIDAVDALPIKVDGLAGWHRISILCQRS